MYLHTYLSMIEQKPTFYKKCMHYYNILIINNLLIVMNKITVCYVQEASLQLHESGNEEETDEVLFQAHCYKGER